MLWGAINYVRGCVRIEICGAAVERFLNVCAQNGIEFWKVRRISADKVCANVRIEGFRSLRPFAGKMMCRVRIIRKTGAPFALKNIIPRVFLWGGAIVCAASLYTMTKYIWIIDATSCPEELRAEVLSLTREAGLRAGMLKTSVSSDDIRTYSLEKSNRISYLAVNVRGSRAEVVAKERIEKPYLIPIDEPCDIIADKDGVILLSQVAQGITIKKQGESVVRGDTIVSGTWVNPVGEWFRVHSQAKIKLQTWRSATTIMPSTVKTKIPTGRIKKRYAFIAGNRRFSFNIIEKEPFSCYDKFIEKKRLSFGEDMELPFELVVEKYVEYDTRDFVVSMEKCREILQARELETLKARYPNAEIIKSEFEIIYNDKFATGKTTLECVEDAGILKSLAGAPAPELGKTNG